VTRVTLRQLKRLIGLITGGSSWCVAIFSTRTLDPLRGLIDAIIADSGVEQRFFFHQVFNV
jgi:hypothetical protein